MRLRYALFLFALALALPAQAQTYLDYFEIPGDPALHGLDYHDGSLWVMVRSSSEPRILQIDPDDGAVLGTTDLAIGFTATGVTWDGSHFWISQSYSSSSQLSRVDTDGTVVEQIPAPSNLSNGLAYDGGTLWVANAYPDDGASLVGVDPADGSVIDEIAFPSTQPGGIAFLGDGTLWTTNVGDDSGSDEEVLWKLDAATGDLLDTLTMPTGAGRPRGLAYDGSQYLYAVMDEPGSSDDVIYKIDLSTEGTPVFSTTTTEIDFGVVDTDLPVVSHFTVMNEGSAPLEIGDGTITGDDAFGGAFDGFTLAPGEDAEIEVSFAPQGYGPMAATLSFATNDVAAPTVEIALSGFGVYSGPYVGVADDAHDFGEVRIENPYGELSQPIWPLEIIGTGDLDPTVTGITITGSEAFSIPDLSYPFGVGTMDTLTVNVTFAPEAVGPHEATLVIETTNPNEPEIEVALSGEGIDPDLDGGDALWTLDVPDNPSTSSDYPKVTHLASAGDLTGNGKADLIVGTENYWVFAVNGDSWGTGDILWAFDTCKDNFNCGAISGGDGGFETSLATGTDIDGDGIPDVVFSTDGGSDHVYALSGADGSVLWSHGDNEDPYLAPYYSLSSRFDVTGDGLPDVLTATGSASNNSPNPYNHRRVYLLDGADGSELWSMPVGLPSFVTQQLRRTDGSVLHAAGGGEETAMFVRAYDEDGQELWSHDASTTPFVMAPYEREDGGEDLLYTGLTMTGNRLVRLDVETGEVVWERAALSTGWALTLPGDLNDNGTADIVAGFHSGEILAFDGEDGSHIWGNVGFVQVFGVDALRDVTGDGVPDVVSATGDGRALLHSGADGSVVWEYGLGNGTLDQAAEVVAVLPDLDGNNAPEVAVGTRHGRLALLLSTGEVLPPVSNEPGSAPTEFALETNYPNPFATSTTIRYALPDAARVTLTVYDLLGRPVRTLVAEEQAAGTHEVRWDGTAASGTPSAAGVYLYRIQAGDFSETRRMVLVR